MTRLFVPVSLQADAALVLPQAVAHRVREVLRARAGDPLVLFDGTGGEYPAIIRTCTRDQVLVETGARQAIERESPLAITLAQGIARGERMDYTLQKAVELGVTRIVPLASARSQVKLAGDRAARRRLHWQGIVVHACEQCGRNRVPEVAEISSLESFIATDDATLRLTLSPGAAHDFRELWAAQQSFSLAIGPEGGLDPNEIAHLTAAGYRAIRLGPRILRTETAALVALATLQAMAGDLCA
jgi:16S rRNA (uracil1498-N3)-methyltransferase